ncbi:MAG: hypothetical protein EXS67_01645 [Candidatus Margulisbacteria bacterium]|nr:hypothetical protein [Candidatus Margulisiibacteriota bacterium]
MRGLCIFLVLILSTACAAEGFVYHHYKIHPTNIDVPPLSLENITAATDYNQERLDELKVKMADLEKALERFKTYYFRRL